MSDLLHFVRETLSADYWVQFGIPVMAVIIFLETGALVAMLPGDSLLFVAGVAAANGAFGLGQLNLVLMIAAIVGDATSYWIGKKMGPRVFSRPRSRLFDPKHVVAARDFYEKHGGKAIILARFTPLVRTFVPVIAGIGGMPYTRFASYNVIGAVAWVASMTVAGYLLGNVPGVKENIEKIVILIVLLSIAPGLVAWLRARSASRKDAKEIATD